MFLSILIELFCLTTADAGSVFGERKGSGFGTLPDFHGISDVSKNLQKSILEAHDDDGFFTNAALARSSPSMTSTMTLVASKKLNPSSDHPSFFFEFVIPANGMPARNSKVAISWLHNGMLRNEAGTKCRML